MPNADSHARGLAMKPQIEEIVKAEVGAIPQLWRTFVGAVS